MKKSFCMALVVLALALVFVPSEAKADSAGGQIFVCQSCTTPPGGDPNLITNTSGFNVGAAGNHTYVSPLLIIVGVPNSGSAPTVSFSGSIFSPGGTPVWGWNGSAAAVSMTSGDAYSLLGLMTGAGGGASESFVNWTGADLAKLGITATNFNLFAYKLPVALSSASGPITIDLGGATVGSFVVAYSCDVTTASNNTALCTDGHIGETPFTNAGLVVPEPGTLALFGTGLLGIAAAIRRRLRG